MNATRAESGRTPFANNNNKLNEYCNTGFQKLSVKIISRVTDLQDWVQIHEKVRVLMEKISATTVSKWGCHWQKKAFRSSQQPILRVNPLHRGKTSIVPLSVFWRNPVNLWWFDCNVSFGQRYFLHVSGEQALPSGTLFGHRLESAG